MFLGICKSFELLRKGLLMKKRLCFGKPSEENEIISSAENTADIKEKYGNGNINNIATYKGERLEGKFVSRNVISKLKSPFCLSL